MAGHRTSGLDLLNFGYRVLRDNEESAEKEKVRKAYGWAATFNPDDYINDPEKGVQEIAKHLPGDIAYSEVGKFNAYIQAKQKELATEQAIRRRQGITQTPQFGPMRGQYFTEANPNPAASPAAIQDRLARTGSVANLDYAKKYADLTEGIQDTYAKAHPVVDPFEGFNKDYAGWLRGMGYTKSSPQRVKEYQQVQKDLKASGRTSINNYAGGVPEIKTGTIPPGYGFNPQTRKMFKLEGGPAEEAAQTAADKAARRAKQTKRAGTTVVQDIQRALDIVESNPLASGPSALLFQHVAGTDTYSAKGFIESALSNVGLDTLQTMRENSPTGGALGQVPIQQQKRLEQVLGSLQLPQKKEIVTDNLKRVKNIYMDIIYGTPDEIQKQIDGGTVDPIIGQRLMERDQLSFDDFGDPITKQPGKIKFLGFE